MRLTCQGRLNLNQSDLIRRETAHKSVFQTPGELMTPSCIIIHHASSLGFAKNRRHVAATKQQRCPWPKPPAPLEHCPLGSLSKLFIIEPIFRHHNPERHTCHWQASFKSPLKIRAVNVSSLSKFCRLASISASEGICREASSTATAYVLCTAERLNSSLLSSAMLDWQVSSDLLRDELGQCWLPWGSTSAG